MPRIALCVLVVLNVPWTVVALRGGTMPLLGLESPGGALFALLWFGLVYPLSALAVGSAAWGLEAVLTRALRSVRPRGVTGAGAAAVVETVGPARGRASDGDPGTVRGVLGEAIAARQSAATRSLVDPLTGLLSRDGLVAALPGVRGGCAVAVLELHRLVHVAEHHGRAVADEALRDVAAVVRRGREADLLARWSPTEIVMVLPLTRASGAAARVGRVLDEVYADVRIGDQPISVSAGVADAADGAAVPAALVLAERAIASAQPRVCVAR